MPSNEPVSLVVQHLGGVAAGFASAAFAVRQVRAVGVEEGEERRLRAQLRQMESRRAAVERCSLVRI